MSRRGIEPKPPWSAVPQLVREAAAAALGAPVVRAARVYGGYAPSATFRFVLGDGRRAFFKGIWRESNEHMHRALVQEEKVYRRLGDRIRPWAPQFLGAFHRDDWHVLLLEDIGPADVPPWTPSKARAAARGYASFHARNRGPGLPRWLPREEWREFAEFWDRVMPGAREHAPTGSTPISFGPAGRVSALAAVARLAGRRAEDAEEWLAVFIPELRERAHPLRGAGPPYTILHLDTRADNVRVRDGLRIFDWNWASVGPHEFDAVAFAQGVAADGGPAPERTVEAYAEVLPLRREVLDASIAAIPGYFAIAAPRPPIPGLPRVRSIQRRQLKASLAWAARHFSLPEPTWIAAVPD